MTRAGDSCNLKQHQRAVSTAGRLIAGHAPIQMSADPVSIDGILSGDVQESIINHTDLPLLLD